MAFMEITKSLSVMKAAEIIGGIPLLAKACGVSVQAAHKWINSRAPDERCLQIEQATDGQVTRYELRPDIFGTQIDRRKQDAA